jgi:hypothetical protein
VYDPQQFRVERAHVQIGYDAAFQYWNVRGVVAERWGHGPIFANVVQQLGIEQVTLTPPDDEDQRFHAVYGLKETWMLGEGPERAQQALDLTPQWMRDVQEALRPRRTVRVTVALFGLYPVDDPVQVSRRLRRHFYRNDNLNAVLSDSLRQHQDHYHAAIDWIVLDDDRRTSLVAGVLGPPHKGAFFTFPDDERDQDWWFGFNYTHNRGSEDGIADTPNEAVAAVEGAIETATGDVEQARETILREVIP